MRVNWENYYRSFRENPKALTMTDHASSYISAMQSQKIEPQTILLGGFASGASVLAFENLAGNMFPEARLYAMDINPQPLKDAQLYIPKASLLQGDLTKTPIKPNSVDLIIMDFTLNCMTLDQAKDFFSSAPDILSPRGYILTAINNPAKATPLTRLQLWWMRNIDKRPYLLHNVDQIIGQAQPLTPTYREQIPHPAKKDLRTEIIAFSKT